MEALVYVGLLSHETLDVILQTQQYTLNHFAPLDTANQDLN